MKTRLFQSASHLEHVVLAAVLASGLATLLTIPAPATGAQAETMRQYQFDVVDGEVALVIKEVDRPVPGANEVLVRVRATSLNRRGPFDPPITVRRRESANRPGAPFGRSG